MYEIIFMGIPCRECDVTEEFLETITEIKTGNCFAITLTDYPIFDGHSEAINSIYGHTIIFNNIEFIKYHGTYIKNKINTMGDVWQNHNRNPQNISNFLLEQFDLFFEKNPFDKVVILTPGSPTIDILPSVLTNIRPIKIVDIKSPITIAAESMDPNYIIRKFDKEFIREENAMIYPEKVNIFYAISGSYNSTDNKDRIDLFFEYMKKYLKPTDDIFYAYVGETVEVKKIKFSNFLDYTDYFSLNVDHLTFGVFKHNV
jgi:hypothetical protein